MKKKLFSYCFLAFFFIQNSFAQKDTVFYKSGKILTGTFGIANDKLSLFVGKDIHKQIFPNDLIKFFSKGKYFYPAELTLYSKSNVYIAELVLDGSTIDLLKLDIEVENPSNYYKNFTRKFFFVKNGKTTPINSNNLDAFYKAYFGSCYSFDENENLENTYNSIVSVLNNYAKCANLSEEIEIKEDEIVNKYGVGLFGGFISNKPNYINARLKTTLKGYGYNYGLSTHIKLIRNMAVKVEIGVEQLFIDAKDTIVQYESSFYFTKKIYLDDVSIRSTYLATTVSKIFNLSPKLEIGTGLGFYLGKYKKIQGEINSNSQFLNQPIIYDKPKPILDPEDEKLTPIVGVIGQFQVEYTAVKNIGIFTKVNYTQTGILKQGNVTNRNLGFSLGFHYYFKIK